jgi:hypothetical protein
MRVLPPPDLDYPDFERDGDSFYDKIGSHKLKRIYSTNVDECKSEDGGDLNRIKTLDGLIREAILNKGETCEKVQDKILSHMTFKVWERFPADMGKYKTDPTRVIEKIQKLTTRSTIK